MELNKMPEEKLKLTWGFELELTHENENYRHFTRYAKKILRDTINIFDSNGFNQPVEWKTQWDIGIDCGVELRSRTNTITKKGRTTYEIDNKFLEEIKEVLRIMKTNGYRPGRDNGLHIHVSSNKPITLRILPVRSVWKTRRSWINSDNANSRYKFVNHRAKNHFEVRLFNSSTCFGYIIKNIKFVLNNTIPSGKPDWTSKKTKINWIEKTGKY